MIRLRLRPRPVMAVAGISVASETHKAPVFFGAFLIRRSLELRTPKGGFSILTHLHDSIITRRMGQGLV